MLLRWLTADTILSFTFPKILSLQNPKFNSISISASRHRINHHLHHHKHPLMASASPSSVVAEYAKSGRSSCKACEKPIDNAALRLGVVTVNNQKRYDMIRWHHLHCLSFNSLTIDSAESISGFQLLKSDDQEALKKLVADRIEAKDTEDVVAKDKQKSTKKRKVKDKDENVDLVEKEPKKSRVKDKDEDMDLVGKEPKKSQSGDQEALKKSVDDLVEGKDTNEHVAAEEKLESIKKRKIKDRDKDVDSVEKESKKLRLLVSDDAEIKIALKISDIKDKYKDATLLPKWRAFHTIIFLEKDDGLRDSSKIAAFDFDGCLANTNVKITGADAWSLMYPSIPDKLQKLYNDGFKLVIFTNESNIDRWTKKRQKAVDSKVGRLNNFIKHVNVPIQVFIACGFDKKNNEDAYRKPRPGMWRVMEKHFNSGIAIDMDNSFYVGDAAGRVNDHSDADIKFAQTIGLKFHLPEEFFDTKG